MKVLSVGEVLWDVFPDREFLGGAALNVCANLVRLGDTAALFSATGDDPRGDAVLQAMHQLSLSTDLIERTPGHPTGTASVTHDAAGEPSFTIQRPAAFDALTLTQTVLHNIIGFAPDWLYMGTLLQTHPHMEELVAKVLHSVPHTRCFYDMNLRTGHWNLALVERLCQRAIALKLNDVEAQILFKLTSAGSEKFSLPDFCQTWAQRFQLEVICVTLGPQGCYIHTKDQTHRAAGYPVTVSDTVGAGDAFAAAFLHGYHRRWPIVRCARFANALGALVASRPGATPPWSLEECETLTEKDERQ